MKTTRIGIILGMLFLFPQTALAHDGWIEVTPSIVEKGQPVTIALFQGNHSNEHKSYRLAGKWDLESTKVTVVSPSGKAIDLTMIDFGEDPEKTGPKGPKGFHIAQFVPEYDGVYTVIARQEKILQHGTGPKFRGVRFARGVFVALSTPTLAEAQKIQQLDRQPIVAEDLEIFAVTNPLAVTNQSLLTLELRYKGKPAAGKVVSVIRKMAGPASPQDLTTDQQGRVTVVAGSADSYLARAKVDERAERSEGQFDLSSYEATYVFQVYNRR
jgi:uncharacterized GH25 family protein